jgi:CDP-paratose 2-epimerase
MGGARYSNCSMLEAIDRCEKIAGKELRLKYVEENRQGDHIWWISDVSKFQKHYPNWKVEYDVPEILREIYDLNIERWRANVDGREK